MPYLARSSAVVHYEEWSEGLPTSAPWVTLINGHTRPLNDFRALGRKLVQSGLRVLTLDNRGAGSTKEDGAFTVDDMADDVVAVWESAGCRSTGVVGLSMGGFIAQTLALLHPGRISKLALISTAMAAPAIRQDEQPWSSDIEAVKAKLLPYFTPDFAGRNEALVRSMARQTAAAVASGLFQRRSEMQRRAIASFDASQRVRTINVPTLVVHGNDDLIISIDSGRQLAAQIPRARLVEVPRAGHLLLAEAPAQLAASLVEFFAP